MPAFVRLTKPQPVLLFHATWESSRTSLQRFYEGAFEAAERRNALMGNVLGKMSAEDHARAVAEDINANHHASIVVLAVDDLLQRLASGLRLTSRSLRLSAGPMYRNDIRFTTLVRACTNAIRHVSEWDDDLDRENGDSSKLFFPYEDNRNSARRELDSIRILQKALGVGMHERLYMAPSLEVLMTVDGQWYDGKSKADFGQLERATLASRDEIIASAPACAVDEVQDP